MKSLCVRDVENPANLRTIHRLAGFVKRPERNPPATSFEV
jgi:hypothetical protein